jgi:uncharacterized membrane protein
MLNSSILKKNQHIKKNLKFGQLISLYAIYSSASIVLFFWTVLMRATLLVGMNTVYASTLPLVLLLVFFIKLYELNKRHIEKIFVCIAIPALISFGLFILPNQIPDEIWHIYRVLNFEKNGAGNMIAPLSLQPDKTPTTFAEAYKVLLAPADWNNVFLVSRDMSSYLSHLYFFPGIVALIGRSLWLNPYVVVYLSRMTNAAIFIVAGYWIIKLIPFGKTVFFIFLLNPMLIQQEASCSADALTNVIALMYATFLILLLKESQIKRWQVSGLVITAVLMVVSKFAYAPLIFLSVLLVYRLINTKKRNLVVLLISILVTTVVIFVLAFYQVPDNTLFGYALDLVRHPVACFFVLLNTFYIQGPYWVKTFAGGVLGALSINIWAPIFWTYLIILSISPFCNEDEDKVAFNKNERVFILVIIFIDTILIILALRQWSVQNDGNINFISGVQGRYFFPIAIYLPLCLIRPSGAVHRSNATSVFTTLILIILLGDFVSVLLFF